MERGNLMNADNLVILNGRLTKEVDLRYSQSGNAVARFTIAINRSRKESDGCRLADFHNCVAFRKTAEIIANHFRKGSMIGIIGELQDNNYEKDGTKHYNKQIIVDTFGFRESKGASNNQNDYPNNNSSNQGGFSNQQQESNPFAGSGATIDISDDDLPF